MEKSKGKTILLVAFLLGLIIWMMVFSDRIANLRRLTAEYEEAQRTIGALTATTKYLATQVVNAESDDAVEAWAYEDRKWIRDGDHRLVIIPVEGTPVTVTPVPTQPPEEENTFRLWWKLFFDTQP